MLNNLFKVFHFFLCFCNFFSFVLYPVNLHQRSKCCSVNFLFVIAYISSSRNKYISIADEIQNLNNYIQLQQERFENKFDYELKADPELAIHTINIPSLLLQPIVENAIEHGLFLLSGKGNLSIHFEYISNNHIRCIINDNGIGRVKSKLLSKDSLVKKESYGDALIRDLINIFNKYEKIKISIEYIDKQEPESGTIVILTFKYPQ